MNRNLIRKKKSRFSKGIGEPSGLRMIHIRDIEYNLFTRSTAMSNRLSSHS